MAPRTAPGSQRGQAFLAVLMMIAAMGASLGVAGTIWHEVRQRQNETELLFVGMQYQLAIRRYYQAVPGQESYPPSLEALLLDPRLPSIHRYLRRPWRDPLTNNAKWGLITAPEGGIMGVYSLAGGMPIKQANFPKRLQWKGGFKSYADWKFIYLPEPRS